MPHGARSLRRCKCGISSLAPISLQEEFIVPGKIRKHRLVAIRFIGQYYYKRKIAQIWHVVLFGHAKSTECLFDKFINHLSDPLFEDRERSENNINVVDCYFLCSRRPILRTSQHYYYGRDHWEEPRQAGKRRSRNAFINNCPVGVKIHF